MPKINRSRLRAILAAEGLTASGDPKLDFPSVSDPDRRAATEKLYGKMEKFERRHGRSKEVAKVMEDILNLNHSLHAAEASLYRRRASGKTAYTMKTLQEIDESGRLTDPETRADVSDWGVNTFRDQWRSLIFPTYVAARTNFDERSLQKQLLEEEFERIKKGNLDLMGYLRARRAGSKFRLNRKSRMAIWAHYASRNSRRVYGGEKTARDNRFDHEGKDFGVTIQASGGYGPQYVTLYWPLENVGIMRRKVNTRRVNWGYDKGRESRTAWAHTILDRLKKASNINSAQRILDQNIKEMKDTEALNYLHDKVSETKANDRYLPVPSHRIVEDIEGGDITVRMNGPTIGFGSKSDDARWRESRQVRDFDVKKRYQKKVNAVRDLLEKARGYDEVAEILTRIKVPYDSMIRMDGMYI